MMRQEQISYTKLIEKMSTMVDAKIVNDAFHGSIVVAFLTTATKEEALQDIIDYRASKVPPPLRTKGKKVMT